MDCIVQQFSNFRLRIWFENIVFLCFTSFHMLIYVELCSSMFMFAFSQNPRFVAWDRFRRSSGRTPPDRLSSFDTFDRDEVTTSHPLGHSMPGAISEGHPVPPQIRKAARSPIFSPPRSPQLAKSLRHIHLFLFSS